MRRWLFFFVILLAGSAEARNTDGTLGLIRTPNDGVPAIVKPGEAFEADLSQRTALKLVGPDPAPELMVEWRDAPGGRAVARCKVAGGAKPGAYALEADDGAKSDRNVRAVFVREEFPPLYAIAHVTDTHIGSNRNALTSQEIFKAVIAKLNTSGAAFAVITGDLTEGGAPEQFQSFIEILDTCTLPTFVCPGNHDRQGLNYENVFGPLTYMFRFGEDGYLSYDTKDFDVADELGRQDADLQMFRRALKPSRWCIGLTHRYEPDQGMRSQIILFVDDPLDYLIFGHRHKENGKDDKGVPWGTTRYTVTPAAINGAIRFFDITAEGVHPRPFETVIDVDPGARKTEGKKTGDVTPAETKPGGNTDAEKAQSAPMPQRKAKRATKPL